MRLLPIIIIGVLLLSFGCITIEDDEDVEYLEYQPGKKGLVVEFEDSKPPDISFAEDRIYLAYKLTNYGPFELSSGDIVARPKGVVSTDKYSPSFSEASNSDVILGAKPDPFTGTMDLGHIIYSPEKPLPVDYEIEIKTEVCFPYETRAYIDSFHISKEPSDMKKAFIASDDISSAPVQISGLKEFLSGDDITFEFMIEHKGKGKVVDYCFPEEDDVETIYVNINNPTRVNCETLGGGNSGSVILEKDKAKVYCSVGTGDENYQTPLEIILEYNYDMEISKEIVIKNKV